jgi:hypothetical protein
MLLDVFEVETVRHLDKSRARSYSSASSVHNIKKTYSHKTSCRIVALFAKTTKHIARYYVEATNLLNEYEEKLQPSPGAKRCNHVHAIQFDMVMFCSKTIHVCIFIRRTHHRDTTDSYAHAYHSISCSPTNAVSQRDRFRRRVWLSGGRLGLAGSEEVVEGGLDAGRHSLLGLSNPNLLYEVSLGFHAVRTWKLRTRGS